MRTRWSAYIGLSTALAGGVIVKALAQRPNFYSATVYLSQSSANLMIMANFLFVAACVTLLYLQKLFYGPLRPIEIEQLYEKAWFAVTETCLAMTIFRGEIGAWFLVMFFALLAGKVWGWIGEGRVEILEQQPPRNPRLFHTRLALSLGLSVLFDMTMLEYVVKQVMRMARPDMMVMFGFEFAVLSLTSLSTAARYAINLVEIGIIRKQKALRIDEIRRERITAALRGFEQVAQQTREQADATTTEDLAAQLTARSAEAVEATRRAVQQPIDEQEIEVEGWEGKGRWIFYLDLMTDFLKLVVYLSFFFILLIFYGLPIHILRDVFMTFRSFFKRIGDFMRYRTATRDMNARYPDASEQEIGSEDVCIICREEMRPYQPPAAGERANPIAERMRPKKLPCGHILHFSCLRSWLERQQICPTCRTNVVSRTPTRTGTTNAAAADGAGAQHGNAPPAERQGPRIYQWGPLRIGIGAARGNMLEDLQQRLGGDGQPRQPQQAHGDGPQQYGFGIRWDGLRRRGRPERSQASIQRQLDEVQRQIGQEYRALGQMTQELRLLRNMDAELTRIRAQRQGGTFATPAAPQPGATALPTITALAGNPNQTIPAGSDQLPAGVVLPDGWSLMPLHPAMPNVQAAVGQNTTALPAQMPPVNHIPHPPGFAPSELLNQFASGVQMPPPPHARNIQPTNVNATDTGNSTRTTLSQPSTAINNSGEQRDATVNRAIPAATESATHRDVPTHASTRSAPHLERQNGTVHMGQSSATSTTSRPQVNGLATQPPVTATVPTTSSSDDPPVASMFSLPSWGSTPMMASSSNRSRNEPSDSSESDEEQSDNGSVPEIRSPSEGKKGSSSTGSSTSKNPTVEDLVEDPD